MLPDGRAAFEIHCAPCHHPGGEGGYLGPATRPPRIAGEEPSEIVERVREGGKDMPGFSRAALSDAALQDLATYVSESAAPMRGGTYALDPFSVGVIVWVALAFFTLGLAALFTQGER
jgi:mono/diheme cytochrome c family protein